MLTRRHCVLCYETLHRRWTLSLAFLFVCCFRGVVAWAEKSLTLFEMQL